MKNAALADLAGLRARHPAEFRTITWGRVLTVAFFIAALALMGLSVVRLQLLPDRFASGLAQLWNFITLMVPPSAGGFLPQIINGLLETLAIAFLGTLVAAVLALPLALLAARNTTIHGIMRFLSRRVLDSIRGVDALIWALIWVSVVGLGPFAGVLAIATSDIGTFGKLFSEALEAAERGPQEGVVASGGGDAARIRFGVLPQVLPVMAGQVLYLFESNTRSSSIIGIVGAGGIGLLLAEMIRTLEWPVVSCIVLLILVVVAVIDQISGRLRAAIQG
jgi:phosphonate transport system permease protein